MLRKYTLVKKVLDVPTPTAEEIAKKWKLTVSVVKRLIAAGEKVEREHTNDPSKANEIARDHLGERPDYYKKLAKMEKSKVVKEESYSAGVRGLGYVSGDPAGTNYVQQYIDTNAMSYNDENGNKLEWIRKKHSDLHNKGLGFEFFDPTGQNRRIAKSLKEGISAGPERDVMGYEIGDYGGARIPPRKLDVKEGAKLQSIKKKLGKAARVGAVVGAMGSHAGKVYDVGNVMTHHDDPGLATATAVSYLHPASRMLQAAPTVLKVDKAGKGENEFKRQKLYGGRSLKMKSEEQIKEDLRKWFREKWVRYDTKGNIKGPCAREEGEGKPKCRPLSSAQSMSKQERAKSARRKRREDPVADRSGKGGKPIMVKTEETLLEKNVPTNPKLWARAKSLAKSKFDVYPSAYANGWASKWYKSKGGGWKSSSVDEACWDNYKQEGMKKKGSKMVPNCVPVEEHGGAAIVPGRYTERPTYEGKSMGQDLPKAGGIERGIYETSLGKKLKYAVKSMAQQHRIGKELGQDAVKDKTYQKRSKGMNKVMKEGYASIGHSYDWAGDVNPRAKFYGDKPKATTTKNDEKDDTYRNSNKGKKVKFAKTVKEAQIDEISAELVGKVSNARFWQGKAPSKTLSRAVAKKFIAAGKKLPEQPPFEGSHKRSHEKSSTHVHRLAMKGMKAQMTKEDANRPDRDLEARTYSGATGLTRTIHEETIMDTKEHIQEAIGNIMEDNLHEMKDNFLTALNEKVMEKLEERKKEIASNYFAQD